METMYNHPDKYKAPCAEIFILEENSGVLCESEGAGGTMPEFIWDQE